MRYIRAVIHQSPDSEDLFSAWPVDAVFEERTRQMSNEIDRMDPDVLLASDPEVLAERLAEQYGVGVPQLLHDQKVMDLLEEIDVRPVGGYRAETAEMYAAEQRTTRATSVTVHLPFEGRHRFAFNIRPTTRSTAGPPRVHEIADNELVIVYATTETDPERIVSHLDHTVAEIDKYLG